MSDKPQTGQLTALIQSAREAFLQLSQSGAEQRRAALLAIASGLKAHESRILDANAKDVEAAQGSPAFIDRLTLTAERLDAMAESVLQVADLPDPVGKILRVWDRPNGLKIRQVATPIGVLGLIFESRPNVGLDAAALSIKSGNALILRGGSESFQSLQSLMPPVHEGLRQAGLPESAVQTVPDVDRSRVGEMLKARGGIDLLIPRGGKSLVTRVMEEAKIPVLAHAEGLCHSFVHRDAQIEMARRVVTNAKMRRTGICSATETLLVDRAIAQTFIPLIVSDLTALGCVSMGDAAAREITPTLLAATDSDFATEWLDARLSIAVVDGVDGALKHIARYSSAHTEAIVTENAEEAQRFMQGVQSAVVMWNASTQFCDGGEFGFGGEIGISTGRLHARGPVGVEQLMTSRYEVWGDGQIRP